MEPWVERIFEFLFKYRPLLFEKGRLALAAPRPAVAAILALAAVALPILLSYRRAGGRSRPADRAALAALRAAALLVLLLCLARPTLLVEAVVPQQSFVGVLLDDSLSMGVADDDGAPRGDFAKQAFGREGAPLLRALRERFKLRFFRFSGAVERLDRVQDLVFRGAATDLAVALGRAQDEMAGVPLAGLVLVSDGADNGGGRLSEALLALQAARIPVFSVGLGRERFSRNVELRRVEAPRSVLRGASFTAGVSLRQRGLSGRRARILVEDGGRVIHVQEVELPREGESAALRVHVVVEDPGPRRLRFRVEQQPGEQMTQDNAQDVLVRAVDRRERILLFDGEPRFEPTFVRRAVAGDRNLQVVALERTAKNKFLRLGVDGAEELAGGFPKTREELFRYPAVVLGSVEASFFSAGQLRMLAEFVSVRGGGLLLLGGPHAFGEGGYAGTPLAEVMPVLLEAGPAPEEPFFAALKVELTPAGVTHGATQLGDSEEDTARLWSGLPGVSAANRLRRTKPGAVTLALGRGEAGGDPQVVLAYQRYGRGKVVAFTVQDSWQWKMNPAAPLEDKTHESLWRQLLRWLVSGVPGQVEVSLERDRVAPDESVSLRAEVADDTFLPLNDARVVARVKEPAGGVREWPLEWSVEKDGEYRGSFRAAEAGLHEVTVVARRGDTLLGEGQAAFEAAALDTEFHDAEMRAPLLRRIAEETGGRFYTKADVDRLPEDLRYTPGTASVLERKELWDMPAWYLALLGLVSAEWAYRRLRGLA